MCDVWKELERHFRNMLPSLTFCKNDFRQQPNLEKKTVKSFKHFLQKISAESQKQMCSHRRFFLAGHGLSKCKAIMKCGKCKDDCHPMALHNRETWHDMNGNGNVGKSQREDSEVVKPFQNPGVSSATVWVVVPFTLRYWKQWTPTCSSVHWDGFSPFVDQWRNLYMYVIAAVALLEENHSWNKHFQRWTKHKSRSL